MVASLFRVEPTDEWKDTKGITGEHDDITRLTIDGTGDACIGNEFDWVRAAGIFGDAHVAVIGYTRDRVVDHILKDGAEPDGIVDLRFLFS